ncbi:F-box protein [Cocos nucifera]|uniref:F-box protein n=1 Tax=Cocos nucifera TaxID=13894 RepID=A0A8K0N1B8_COCNU|nr:F-box protein [Cocos nucifera]
MEFDDGEWVITDGADVGDPATDGDWVVDNGDEGAVAGVFFHVVSTAARRPAYAPFGSHPRHLPDPALSFLPPAVSVRSSSHGLVLCRGAWSSYYVCNPATAHWTPIPRPPRPHPFLSSPALVLVSRPDSPSLFHLVCLLESGTGGATAYRFDTFSSATGQWRSDPAPFPTDAIVPRSGVSAAGVAYWRTASLAVLAYDPATGATRIFPAPPGCGGEWQLGEAGGGRLCCARVTDSAVEIYALGPSDRWTLLGLFAVAAGAEDGEKWEGGEPILCREAPRPLRFESANLEVVLWVDGRVVAVDLRSRWVRELRLDGLAPGPEEEEYVAHVLEPTSC